MGLGNPGGKYRNTRHNIGWKAVEAFAVKENLDWEGENSLIYALGEEYVLVRPVTFMNMSGKAVREAFKNWGKEREDIVVLHDDIDLSLGRVKIKFGGGTGGHRGLESVIYELGTSQFGRVKMGINIGFKPASLSDFVLQDFTEAELEKVKCSVERAGKAIDLIMKKGWQKAMNMINGEDPCSFR